MCDIYFFIASNLSICRSSITYYVSIHQSVLSSISILSLSTHLSVEQKDVFGPQERSDEVAMGNQENGGSSLLVPRLSFIPWRRNTHQNSKPFPQHSRCGSLRWMYRVLNQLQV